MSNQVSQLPFALGTYQDYAAGGDFVLGRIYEITDGGPNVPGTARVATNRRKRVMLVKNSSGIALLPKMGVQWSSSAYLKEIIGYTNVTAQSSLAGIVDEWLPSTGVPDGKCFFITVEGPTLYINDVAAAAGNVYSIGDLLGAQTAAASTVATTAGRFTKPTLTAPTTTASALTLVNEFRGLRMMALSASTTGNTNADRLGTLKFFE